MSLCPHLMIAGIIILLLKAFNYIVTIESYFWKLRDVKQKDVVDTTLPW